MKKNLSEYSGSLSGLNLTNEKKEGLTGLSLKIFLLKSDGNKILIDIHQRF